MQRKKKSIQAVIFDLDGTLIDSAPGILGCFDKILHDAGIKPLLPLDKKLIGPPLRQAIMMITGVKEVNEIDDLIEHFKELYDKEGYLATRVYDGIEEVLETLYSIQVPMAIATNKRLVPTLKILEYLGWKRYFRIIGTLDMKSPPYPDKGALIRHLLELIGADAKLSLYVGDKEEDGETAHANSMAFIAVSWGYGNWKMTEMSAGWTLVQSPSELNYIGSSGYGLTVQDHITTHDF